VHGSKQATASTKSAPRWPAPPRRGNGFKRDDKGEALGNFITDANRQKPEFARPFKIRTSAVTCGYYRTSSPVTALPMMIMRWISDVPSKS
jgi:hypothetical protein